VDMGEMLCEQDEVDTLWKQIERAPRKKRARSAETPEEAIATLERAAIEGDVQQMRSMLSKKLYEQERTEPICSPYAEDREMLTMCILADLMSDEPVNPTCTISGTGSRCTTGHHVIVLDQRDNGWVIVGSDAE